MNCIYCNDEMKIQHNNNNFLICDKLDHYFEISLGDLTIDFLFDGKSITFINWKSIIKDYVYLEDFNIFKDLKMIEDIKHLYNKLRVFNE